jgi:hypothetical protein
MNQVRIRRRINRGRFNRQGTNEMRFFRVLNLGLLLSIQLYAAPQVSPTLSAETLRMKAGLKEPLKVNIAILAKGFGNTNKLPEQFKIVEDYGRKDTVALNKADVSGRRVADAYLPFITPDSTVYLMNANGVLNLEDAVEYAIGRVDLIVSAHSSPADVETFYALVKKAKEKNIPWIQQPPLDKKDTKTSEIMIPGDNPSVVTVGDPSAAPKKTKPDIVFNFNGAEMKALGVTSNDAAAATFAGILDGILALKRTQSGK